MDGSTKHASRRRTVGPLWRHQPALGPSRLSRTAIYLMIFGNDQSKWLGNAKFVNERLMHISRLRT